MGEFLINAQGEDVVAGVRTPMPHRSDGKKFPEAFEQFKKVCETLENHYRDMQDMEFTVENMENSICSRQEMVREQLRLLLRSLVTSLTRDMRTEEEAVAMIDPRNLDTLLHPQFDAMLLKLLHQWVKVLVLLLVLLAVRLYSLQRMLKNGRKRRESCSCSS